MVEARREKKLRAFALDEGDVKRWLLKVREGMGEDFLKLF